MRAIKIGTIDNRMLDDILRAFGNFIFEKSVSMRGYSCTFEDMTARFTGRVASREYFKPPSVSLPAKRRAPCRRTRGACGIDSTCDNWPEK